MKEQLDPAAAQSSVDLAFSAAWRAARKNVGSFVHATDEAGVHRAIQLAAPEEYAEYERAVRASRAVLRGTKYEGSVIA